MANIFNNTTLLQTLLDNTNSLSKNIVDNSSREREDMLVTRNYSEYSNDRITIIRNGAFYSCKSLESVSFPVCENIGSSAFTFCTSLSVASFPMCENIGNDAFMYCSSLTALYLSGSTICTLANSNAFTGTLISTTGFIYVPSSLVASYQAATNWSYFSSRITGF